MSNIEKWERAREGLVTSPTMSDRQLAKNLELSPTFVGRVRKRLEQQGTLLTGMRQGKDMKYRRLPARKQEQTKAEVQIEQNVPKVVASQLFHEN